MGCKMMIEGKMRTITTRKDGYQIFTLNGKIKYLHRYLAEKHIPNPENLPAINHKDGNPSNNSLDNLEWTTKRKNCEHARLNGLSEEKSQGIPDLTFQQYLEMFRLRNCGLSYNKISDIMGVGVSRIKETIKGKRYKDYGLRLQKETTSY